MKTINKMKKIYKLGLRWAIFDAQDELFIQIVYIALVIAELAILWDINYINAIIYTSMMILHLLSMYILGYLKDCWEGSILQGSHKEEYYQKIYFALNTVFLVVTMLLTKSPMALLLVIIPTLGAILIMILWQLLVEIIARVTKNENWAYNYVKIYLAIFYSMIIMLVIIPVGFLPIFIVGKLAIVGAFIACIPFIIVGADNGMEFLQLFSVMK